MIALFPVLVSIGAYEFIITGNFGWKSAAMFMCLLASLVLYSIWPKITSGPLRHLLLYSVVLGTWGYICFSIVLVLNGGQAGGVTIYQVMTGVLGAVLAYVALILGEKKIGSSAVFSVLGMIATTVWGWSVISASSVGMAAKPLAADNLDSSNSNGADSVLSATDVLNWGYSGKSGPEYWSKLDPSYRDCEVGKRQSPINLERRFPFASGNLTLPTEKPNVDLVKLEYSFQLNVQKAGSLTYRGQNYKPHQVNFHTPSEHTVDGIRYPMELQIFHRDESGKNLAISIFVEKGHASPGFESILESREKDVAQVSGLNIKHFYPVTSKFWAYSGSITRPPCTEGVSWLVMKAPIEFSESQIARYRKLYPMNARPVQPLFDRQYQLSTMGIAH
jgi:carbonic anhydrase